MADFDAKIHHAGKPGEKTPTGMKGVCPVLTMSGGAPQPTNSHSMSAGPRGPLLQQDVYLYEKMSRFNRERVPERVVHAKGYAAYGTFTVTKDITKWTKAKLFSEVGKKTEMFARFSTVGGEKGSADTARDPRGFSLKFYTEEGNWDLVGNNTDPLRFSDFIHTQKRDPASHLKPDWMRWDYWTRSPESLHQVMVLYSDRGTPKSARFMHGFGSHTFSFINADNERFWVKFHFKTQQGIQNFTGDEAKNMAGEDPDYSTRDLWEAIEKGDYPKWTLYVQIMPEAEADNYKWHPFDLTKVWMHDDYPLHEVGVMELNRNPRNFFAEVEQAAFEPSNVVPGISFSPDKTLQNRLISYKDAHNYRIGANYYQIPVNRPRCPVHDYHFDGKMRVDGNHDGMVNYHPNSFTFPEPNAALKEPPLRLKGSADRWNEFPCDDEDYYGQPRLMWEKAFDEDQRKALVKNLAESVKTVPEELQKRVIYSWGKVSKDLGSRLAEKLGLKLEDGVETPIGEQHFPKNDNYVKLDPKCHGAQKQNVKEPAIKSTSAD